MTSKKQLSSPASASDVFAFQLADDDDGLSTPKRNVAKSGIPSGYSTNQCLPKSLPETIEEKAKSSKVADVESLEEEEATTIFKLPVHRLLSKGLEIVEPSSYGGDTDHDFEKCTYFVLPAIPHAISNPSLQSTASETHVHVTNFENPLVANKDE